MKVLFFRLLELPCALRNTLKITFVGLLAVLLLTGCSSNDAIDEIVDPVALEKFTKKVAFKRQWARSIGNGQGKKYTRLSLGFESTADGQDVFAVSENGVVARFNKAGKKQWQVRLKETISAGVGVGDGLAVVGTLNGELIALSSSDGSEQWRINLGVETLSAPQIDDNVIVVQTFDGKLLGLDAENGEQRWAYISDAPLLTLRGSATPVIKNGVVYTGFASGKLIAISLDKGLLLWDKAVAIGSGQTEIDRIVDIDASPLVTESNVYTASYQGNLFAFRREDGLARWRYETSSYRGLAEGFDHIYLVDAKSYLRAISAQKGEEKWTQESFILRDLSAPAIYRGYLIVADYKGYLHALSQVDGTIIGRTRIDGSGARVPMAVANNLLYVYSNDGKLATYSLKNLAKK